VAGGAISLALRLRCATVIPHYKAGKLRLLAQSSETRSPNLPEVPTLQEAGFERLVLETWYAAFVPLGTPAPAIARLNAEMDKALADPVTGKSLLQTATEPVGGSAEQLARVARADSDKYARLARELYQGELVSRCAWRPVSEPAHGAACNRYGWKIALNSAARRKPALASCTRACALAQSS
jgi:tripartite-type tricarboxylate transporter receptor subunit TctC